MNTDIKWEILIDRFLMEFWDKEPGHCLRVDNMIQEDAERVCRMFRLKVREDVESFVLANSYRESSDKIFIRVDESIEKRNKKEKSICLFVPIGLVDAAMSSMKNSFSVFPLQDFFEQISVELREKVRRINTELRNYIDVLYPLLKTPAIKPTAENEIGYYEAILNSPTLKTAGVELWRVGLIPDLSDQENYQDRLKRNRDSVKKLIAPTRAHTSIEDRVHSLGLMPDTIQGNLIFFFRENRVQGRKDWLKKLMNSKLTFDKWKFPESEKSDLIELKIESFIDKNGNVLPKIGLKQPQGAYTDLIAEYGKKKKLRVKWDCQPKNPKNVEKWKIELLPSNEEYGRDDDFDIIELLSKKVKVTTRNVNIPLEDLLEDSPFKKVQIKISALDEYEQEVRKTNEIGEFTDEIWEVWSEQDFWLEECQDNIEENSTRKETVRSIPDAYLKTALKTNQQEIVPKFFPWESLNENINYFPFLLDTRTKYRLGISRVLRELQEDVLNTSDSPVICSVSTTGVNLLKRDDWNIDRLELEGLDEELLGRLNKARRSFFDYVRKQEPGKILECIRPDDPELDNRICYYATVYKKILQDGLDKISKNYSNSLETSLRNLLCIDCLEIEFKRGKKDDIKVMVMLPIHPLRAFWYISYSQLIKSWIDKLIHEKKDKRKNMVDEEVVQRLAPSNIPAFLPCGEKCFNIFLDNLQFMYGVFIPVDTRDPGKLYSEVAIIIGMEDLDTHLTDLNPDEVIPHIQDYLDTHYYLDYMRVAVVNPGEGNFVGQVLRKGLVPPVKKGDDPEEYKSRIRHIDIIAHMQGDLQTPLTGFQSLLSNFYETFGIRHSSHLTPLVGICKRRMKEIDNIVGGDVQIAFCMDHFIPRIITDNPLGGVDSSAVYGLLTRYVSDFKIEQGVARWTYSINFSEKPEVEKHPVRPLYTDYLLETHKIFLQLIGILIEKKYKGNMPCLEVCIEQENLNTINALHRQSDWVITIDRFLGVELFDSYEPDSPEFGSDKYIIDYTPRLMEGANHRRIVTTAWQDEILTIIEHKLPDIGLNYNKELSKKIMESLKSLSGRFALKLLGVTEEIQKQMISVAMAVKYLRNQTDFKDSIIVPLGFHKEILQPLGKTLPVTDFTPSDFLLITPTPKNLHVYFFRVDLHSGQTTEVPLEVMERLARDNEKTEEEFKKLFFSDERLDIALFKSWIASILRFYLERGKRYKTLTTEQYNKLLPLVNRIDRILPKYYPELRCLIFLTNHPCVQNKTSYYDECKFDIVPISKSASVFFPDEETLIQETMDRQIFEDENKIDEILKKESTIEEIEPHKQDSIQTEEEFDVEIPPEPVLTSEREELNVQLGIAIRNNQPVTWKGSVKGSPHILIVGIPGQGKSVTLSHIMHEIHKAGVPFVTIDFHGQYSNKNSIFRKTIVPRVIFAHKGLPFSPFYTSDNDENFDFNQNAYEIAEIISHVAELGDIQRDTVYEAVKNAYKSLGYGRESEKGKKLQTPTMGSVFKQLKRMEQKGSVKNVVARCRSLFEFGAFQDSGNEDFGSNFALQGHLVIDVSGISLDTVRIAVGSFLLRKLWKDMFCWGETDKIRLAVILDETHRLSKDPTLPKIMREGRKFGVVVILASQQVKDFHEDIITNRGTMIAFRCNYPESGKVSNFYGASGKINEVQRQLEHMNVGHALIMLPGGFKPVLTKMDETIYQGLL